MRLAVPPGAASARALAVAAACALVAADTHPPATRAPATAAMASMAAIRFLCMTNILCIKGGTGQRLRQIARERRARAVIRARAGVADHVGLWVQLNDCAAGRLSVREGLRERRRAHQRGRAGMLWDGGREARRSHRPDTGRWAAVVEDQRNGDQCGGDDHPQQQHGLRPAQARAQPVRLREGSARARVPPGAARTGWRPPAPYPDLLACRHLLACGQPAEDIQHGSQPGVRTSQAVRNGVQGLALSFGEARHHHVRGWGGGSADPGCMSLAKTVLRGCGGLADRCGGCVWVSSSCVSWAVSVSSAVGVAGRAGWAARTAPTAATAPATRTAMVRPCRNALAAAWCSACPRAGWPRAAILPAAA